MQSTPQLRRPGMGAFAGTAYIERRLLDMQTKETAAVRDRMV